jgi:hypothetical protein
MLLYFASGLEYSGLNLTSLVSRLTRHCTSPTRLNQPMIDHPVFPEVNAEYLVQSVYLAVPVALQ